jgi:hypothetical protein
VNNPILNRNSEIMKTSNLSIDRSPLRSGLLFIALAFGYFALSSAPVAFGVVPPPDGGYPNFTTAEGTNARTLQLVGIRSLPTQRAASTPLPGRERCFSTPQMKIRRLERRRF